MAIPSRKKSKATAVTVACSCSVPCPLCECKLTTTAPLKQPRPDADLATALRKFESELRDYHEESGDRVALRDAECCAALLEAEHE